MRIMFMANAPWCATGYGVAGKHLVHRLQALGHDVAYFAFYGLKGGMLELGGVKLYPVGRDVWGRDVVDAHMQHFKGDILISMLDVWATPDLGQIAQEGGWAWCPWMPVDYDPVPKRIVDAVDLSYTPLPYSRWGTQQLHDAGVSRARYMPIGVDTSVFKPGDKVEARRELKLPEDAFIIGTVGANKDYPNRKSIPEQLLAFKRFQERNPDVYALFYLHTWSRPDWKGLDISEMLEAMGLVEGVNVWVTDKYRYLMGMPEAWMSTLYQAMDIFSLPSMGEGFGIPIVEAQACGTPVVTCNNTSMPELTKSGILVMKQQLWWEPIGSWRYVPDVDEIVEAYEHLYHALQRPEEARRLCNQAVAGVQAYDYDVQIEQHWRPFLADVEASLTMEVPLYADAIGG